MKRFLYIAVCLTAVVFAGCEGRSTVQTTTSSVAKLSAFRFADNDTMPGLAKAVFTIDERLDTGLVWNKDSILFGTDLTKVVPRFTFAATPGAAYLRFPDTIVVLTGYDTLDFSIQPIYLTIRSSDGKNTKVYSVKPTVHQVDPDLYTWVELEESVYPGDESEQRVVSLDSAFVMIKSNGFDLEVFRSEDGYEWTDSGDPAGLPAGTSVRQIISNGDTLFYGQGMSIYTSTDGLTWTERTMNHQIYTMLMYWNDCVWALVENEGYELAVFRSNQLLLTGLKPDEADFPVSDFATVSFRSASLRPRAMIIGGFAMNGRPLDSRWNLEYSPYTPENGGYRLQNYSADRHDFTTVTGASVVWYDKKLMLFGGMDENKVYFGQDIFISEDEGLNWTAADSTKNRLPDVYKARQKQSAIVRNQYIYLFGGQDRTTTYSDVYRGRLNSINW